MEGYGGGWRDMIRIGSMMYEYDYDDVKIYLMGWITGIF